MNAGYRSFNTRLFSNGGGIASDSELRNNREYQELAEVQGGGLYYSTEWLPNQATLSVLSWYLEVITNVRCRGSQYTLTAACIFDKIRSIKRAIHSGGLEDCTVGTRLEDGLEDGLEGDRQKKNEDDVISRLLDVFCLFCVPKNA